MGGWRQGGGGWSLEAGKHNTDTHVPEVFCQAEHKCVGLHPGADWPWPYQLMGNRALPGGPPGQAPPPPQNDYEGPQQ